MRLFPSDAGLTRREHAMAGAVTVVVHLLLLTWVLRVAGQGMGGASDQNDGLGTGLAVTYVTLTPSAASPRDTKTETTPSSIAGKPPKEPVPNSTPTPQTKSEEARVLSENGERASASQSLDARSAAAAATASAEGGSSGDDLLANYHAALRAAIQRKWSALTPRPFPADCVLQLSQAFGGKVTATSANGCALAQEDRLQLEAAALMAQPLPYAGFESVFTAELGLKL